MLVPLLTLVLYAHPLLAAGQPGPGLFFSTHAMRTRPLCKLEIPADLNSDGEDEVLLLSDRHRGGDEVTFFQLLSQSGDFLAGPYRPGADIQDLRVLNVDEDANPEVIVCTESPSLVQVVQSGLDSATSHPLEQRSSGRDAIRVLGVLDVDDSPPREILLAITPRDSSATRIAAFHWADGKIAWSLDLPGALAGDAVWWGADPQRPVVVPWSSASGAGIWLIDRAGSLLRELHLAAESVEVSAAVLDAPLGESSLVTLTRTGSAAELAAWVENGERPLASITILGARPPVMLCAYRGAQHIAVATYAGDVVVLDLGLGEVVRFALPDPPATLLAAPDLDQDGSSDLICRVGQGIACVRLPDGAREFWPGATSAHVMRKGFGRNPLLVLRTGEQYSSHEMTAEFQRPAVRLTPFIAGLFVLGALVAGALTGHLIRSLHQRGFHRRLLAASDAPAAIVRGRSIVWANGPFLRRLQVPALPRSASLSRRLSAAGFSTRPFSPIHSGVPIHVVRGDRSYRLVTTPLGRDPLLRPHHVVCMEEVPVGAGDSLHDAWALAAGELAGQIRTCLSTIRLAAQWVLGRSPADEPTVRHRLNLVLSEARDLRNIADVLAEAAQLADEERKPVDLHDVIRQTIAVRGWGQSVTAHEGGPAVIRASRRQIVLALDVVLGPLLGREEHVQVHISVVSSRMEADDGNALTLTLRCVPGHGQPDVSIPRYAAALAEAVVMSHGGAFRSTRSDGGLTMRLAFPRP
ncbi:MAG: hypothetical protein MUE60_05075, partial [Candidatus Eisenbacteria bacterium]|nr:hypothetical protein [Candidatus Eisenbacteria bacterium]